MEKMNPIVKAELLKKIDEELKHLASKKSTAFLRATRTQSVRDHAEWDRLTHKMNGIFLIRHMIIGDTDVIECYRERCPKILNKENLLILSSDSIKQADKERNPDV